MTSERRVLLVLIARSAEAARLRERLGEMSGPPVRRRRETAALPAPLPGQDDSAEKKNADGPPPELMLRIGGRPRSAILSVRQTAGPLIAEHRRWVPLARDGGLDLRESMAALGLAQETVIDSAAAAPDWPRTPVTVREAGFAFEGTPLAWSAERTAGPGANDGAKDSSRPRSARAERIEIAAAEADAGALLRCALALHQSVPLPIAWPEAATATDKDLLLDADDTAATAFGAAGRYCLAQVVGNRHGVLAGDADAVHRMRVGLRRLRALLGLYKPILDPEGRAEQREALSTLQRSLGPVRDWDVFIAEVLQPLQRLAGYPETVEAALAAASAEREAAHRAAAAAVLAPEFTRTVLSAAAWLASDDAVTMPEGSEPAAAFAERVLARQDRKLRKAGRGHAEMSPEDLHEVRILGKKLRYAVEFFGSLYPGRKQRRFLKRLKAVQDVLGAVNDAAVAGTLAQALAERMQKTGAPAFDAGEASGLVRGWVTARAEAERARFEQVWKDYREASRFWK